MQIANVLPGGRRAAILRRLVAGLGPIRDTLHLSELLVDALTELPGVEAVCASRPGSDGVPLVAVLKTAQGADASRVAEVVNGNILAALCHCLSVAPGRGADGEVLGARHLKIATCASLKMDMRQELAALGLRSVTRISWPQADLQGHLWLFARRATSLHRAVNPIFIELVAELVALGGQRLPDPGPFTAIERQKCRAALRNGDMVMHYQPVIDLQSGRLIKAEALARLREGGGLLLPERFLPLFDDEDLFVLYRQGLHHVLNDAQRWAREGPAISLGLNFPPQGLRDPRYLEATVSALAATPLPNNCRLYLEMLETETLDLADPERLSSLFEPWLALGVRFAQDDLGAGYSSLLRLHRLPFEVVKIDQALVRLQAQCPDRGTIRKVLAFIAALTHLAHVLGLRVCVEGLENPVLADAAAAIGADFGQGFSIAEPMPARALVSWLAARTNEGSPQSYVANDEMNALESKQERRRASVRRFGLNSSAYALWYEQIAERIEHTLSAPGPVVEQ